MLSDLISMISAFLFILSSFLSTVFTSGPMMRDLLKTLRSFLDDRTENNRYHNKQSFRALLTY